MYTVAHGNLKGCAEVAGLSCFSVAASHSISIFKGVMEMMRVTVKGAPTLLGWCYTTLRKTLMEADAEGFARDFASVPL